MVDSQYTFRLTSLPAESLSTSFARYVVDSPDTAGMVTTPVLAPSPPTDTPVAVWLYFSVPSRENSFTLAVSPLAAAWSRLTTTTDLES